MASELTIVVTIKINTRETTRKKIIIQQRIATSFVNKTRKVDKQGQMKKSSK